MQVIQSFVPRRARRRRAEQAFHRIVIALLIAIIAVFFAGLVP